MAFGQSLHLDLFGVEPALCDDLNLGYQTLDELAAFLGMHKQSPPFIFRSPAAQFPDKAGLSGWVPLIESGISLHTLIPAGFVTVDIYTCGELDIEKTTTFVTTRFRPVRIERHHLMRGVGYAPPARPRAVTPR
jgi:S-adenosylmethionine/arginine decarboxylase-like enzyme